MTTFCVSLPFCANKQFWWFLIKIYIEDCFLEYPLKLKIQINKKHVLHFGAYTASNS